MDLEKLEETISSLVCNLDEDEFIFSLLRAYDFPKATITRLKNGDRNQSKKPGEVLWKKNLCFTDKPEGDLFTCIDVLRNDPAVKRHHPRFIVVTDYEAFLAVDTKTQDSLDISLTELPKRANFFLPWAGMEKSAITSENPADIKAAEKMGQLYDLLLQNNEIEDEDSRHALNVFLSRLLFCFFAEDTGIFEDDQFTKMVDSHTVEDGSNLQPLLERLFGALNEEDRSGYPDYLRAFPYVNGGLFADALSVPVFSRKARKMLIDCGALNWKAINPDIFGSMMQAVALGEERSSIGMHYTSVVNIMKVIEPLFLNDLKEAVEKADGNEKKLEKLLDRLYHIRIFDPACGSGNFLIIAYKELCRLEMQVFQKLQELNPTKWSLARAGIRLNQFFGIEIDDFPAEIAQLSLWLAEHQMNLEFKEVFGAARPTLPLESSGRILCGSAPMTDWRKVCPTENIGHVYLLGNPPYSGFKKQTTDQKREIEAVFSGKKNFRKLDYISCWFIKAADYVVGQRASFAFVSTSSVCQGEHIGLLWPHILGGDIEIEFCHTPFRWTNSARGNAGVTCVVIGMSNASSSRKVIYDDGRGRTVKSINPYLTPGSNSIVVKRFRPLSKLSPMTLGDMAKDGGHLILSTFEKNEIIENWPTAARYVRRLVGAQELINGGDRWCLWIVESDLPAVLQIPPLSERLDKASKSRRQSSKRETQEFAKYPYRFVEIRKRDVSSIVVPTVSSERRHYIPIIFANPDEIINAPNQVIYDPAPHMFSVICSRMHMTWVRAVAGRLKSDLRYSSALCYNTFPFPSITKEQEEGLAKFGFKVLDERERHPEKTLAELYDPRTMPSDLRRAHEEIDLAVEKCYREAAFNSDGERLEHLFVLYEKLCRREI